MKTKILYSILICTIIFSHHLSAQFYEPVFFDGTSNALSTLQCADGNYATILRNDESPNGFDLVKYEADGGILWRRDIGAGHYFGNVRLYQLPDGGFAAFDRELYYRIDASGDLLMAGEIEAGDLGYASISGDEHDLYLQGIVQNAAGFQILTEGYADGTTNSWYYVLTQMDGDMNAIWSYANLEENYIGYFQDIINIDDKTYFTYWDDMSEMNMLRVIDNISGVATAYPISSDLTSRYVQAVSDGIISAGHVYDYSEPTDRITKYDTTGAILWSKEYTYYDSDTIGTIWGIAEMPGGDLISLNELPVSPASSEGEFVLRRYTPEGDTNWQSPVLFSSYDFRIENFALADDKVMISAYQNITGGQIGVVLITDTLGSFFKLAVEGYIYNDANANGAMDAGETPLANQIVYTTPDTAYAVSDATGKYHLNIFATGTYHVQMNLPLYWDLVEPASYSITFDEADAGLILTGHDFRLNYTEPVSDVETTVLQLADMWPGFITKSEMVINNFGNQVADAGTMYFTHNSSLSYLDGSTYESYADTTLVFGYTALNPYQTHAVWGYFDVGTELTAGDTVQFTGSTGIISDDIDPVNNNDTLRIPVRAPYDPNHVTVNPAGAGDEGFISYKTEWLTYTIEFQNVGTAPAHFVYVVDTLDPLLDIMSIKMLAASHSYTMEITAPGIIKWSFNDIDLADSLSDEEASKGYVCFRMKIKDAAVIGDRIEKTAAIYFDYNPPVITNTAKITLSDLTNIYSENMQAGELYIYPNPVSGNEIHLAAADNLQNAIWQITDITGRLICTGILKEPILSIPDEVMRTQQQYVLSVITDKNLFTNVFTFIK